MIQRQSGGLIDHLSAALTVLFFGTLWGATEALVGGLLHRTLPAMVPGRIMLAVALVLMGYAVRRTRQPWMPAAMALVAAPLKLLAAPIYGLPLTVPEVINPALAILAEGFSLAVLAAALGGIRASQPRLGLAAALAGAAWALPYAALVRWGAMAVYPSQQVLESLGTGVPEWALDAPGMAGFLAATVPYGALAGLVAGLLVAASPVAPRQLRPAWLAMGTLLWLTIFFASSWLI